MVRHDRPSVQSITIAVEDKKRVFDDLSDLIGPQPTGTQSPIEPFIPQAFRLRRAAQPEHRFFRQAVGKPERHELDDVLRIEMREISARMPALVVHAQR